MERSEEVGRIEGFGIYEMGFDSGGCQEGMIGPFSSDSDERIRGEGAGWGRTGSFAFTQSSLAFLSYIKFDCMLCI